jgi:hypothetical protein
MDDEQGMPAPTAWNLRDYPFLELKRRARTQRDSPQFSFHYTINVREMEGLLLIYIDMYYPTRSEIDLSRFEQAFKIQTSPHISNFTAKMVGKIVVSACFNDNNALAWLIVAPK